MGEKDMTSFAPDYAVIPGATVEESLQASGITQNELAERTGLARKTINGIINGREPISPDTAIRLEKVFRVPARFWIDLQKNYEGDMARLREAKRLSRHLNWIREEEIPLKELIARGAVPAFRDPMEQLRAVLTFFGVASPEEYKAVWGAVREVYFYRKSTKQRLRFGAVSAWLRLGELEGMNVSSKGFDKTQLELAIRDVRNEVSSNIAECQRRLRARLSECGVVLVFVPGIRGAPIYGATRWLQSHKKALIQMSLRGKDDGNFWFTLFHELAHILLHGKRNVFLEIEKGQKDKKEEEADRWAGNRLIADEDLRRFVAEHGGGRVARLLRISKQDIIVFARQMKVSPGVVVGRLQHEGHLPFTHCNDLKVRLDFAQ